MKLKLEQQEVATILTVSESLTGRDAKILHAGLQKLQGEKSHSVVLDLLQAELKDPEVVLELLDLPYEAFEMGFTLLLVSQNQNLVGHAKTLQEASELLKDPQKLEELKKRMLEGKVSQLEGILEKLQARYEEKYQDGLGLYKVNIENDRLKAQMMEMVFFIETLRPKLLKTKISSEKQIEYDQEILKISEKCKKESLGVLN